MLCSCEEIPSVPYFDLGIKRGVGQFELASLAEASNSASESDSESDSFNTTWKEAFLQISLALRLIFRLFITYA